MLKNKNSFLFLSEKILYWKSLNIVRNRDVPQIFNIKVSFHYRKESQQMQDNFVSRFFYFLECFCSRRPVISIQRKSERKYRTSKGSNLLGQLTLRSLEMYNFVGFFVAYIYPRLRKNFVKINTLASFIGHLALTIKDLSVFPGLIEETQHNIPLKFDYIFKNSSNFKTKFLTNEFSFFNF
jgi:ribosomal protein L5